METGTGDGLDENQTTLAWPVSDKVTFVRPPTPGWKKPMRPPSRESKGILGLPDELLHNILALTTSGYSRYDGEGSPSHFRPYVDIAQTCRRFYRLITPMMYSAVDISLGYNYLSACWNRTPLDSLKKLKRSFQENPHLGEYCEELSIQLHHPRTPLIGAWEESRLDEVPMDETTEGEVEVAVALAALLTGTKLIWVTGSFHRFQKIWLILSQAALNMPRLERVSLSHFHKPTLYGPICESLCRATHLKSLEVSGIVEITGPEGIFAQVSVLHAD